MQIHAAVVLLRLGADPSALDAAGASPLDIARASIGALGKKTVCGRVGALGRKTVWARVGALGSKAVWAMGRTIRSLVPIPARVLYSYLNLIPSRSAFGQ